ncbi:esterase, partial [Streptomyces wedmorensis]
VRAVNDAGQTGPLSDGVAFLTANRASTTQSTADFNGDGKADVGVLCNYGRQTAGTNRTGLWKFTGTGTGFADPAMTWDSASSGSWNWISSDLA